MSIWAAVGRRPRRRLRLCPAEQRSPGWGSRSLDGAVRSGTQTWGGGPRGGGRGPVCPHGGGGSRASGARPCPSPRPPRLPTPSDSATLAPPLLPPYSGGTGAPHRPGRGADLVQQGWLACAGPQGLSWVLGQGTAGSAPGVQGTLAPARCGHVLVLPGAPPLTPVSLTPVPAAGPRPLGHHLDWGPPRGPALPQAHGWCARSRTFSATVMGTHPRGAEGPSRTAVVWG